MITHRGWASVVSLLPLLHIILSFWITCLYVTFPLYSQMVSGNESISDSCRISSRVIYHRLPPQWNTCSESPRQVTCEPPPGVRPLYSIQLHTCFPARLCFAMRPFSLLSFPGSDARSPKLTSLWSFSMNTTSAAVPGELVLG